MKNSFKIIFFTILFFNCSASREKDFISAEPYGGEPPPEIILSENIDQSIYEVQFINENLGFAGAKQSVLKTVDGGESWSEWDPQETTTQGWNLTPSISEVLFISESIGFINRGYGMLFKTSNGGISYELIYELEGGVIMDIFYVNGTLIISGSDTKKTLLYDDDDGEINPTSKRKNTKILISNDDGESFEVYDFEDSNNNNTDITFFSSYFSSPNVGYIVGESGHFLKTTDGGNNWTKIDLNTFKNIFDIEKINDNTLILVGEDGFIYKYNI